MNPIPVAVLVSLDEDRRQLVGTRVRTQRGKVHQEGEDNNPVVPCPSEIATIELEEWPTLDTCATELNREPTKMPSANQVFIWNATLGTMLIAL